MRFFEQLSGPLTEALGWTLLHSIWQALLITIAVMIILKLISNTSSHIRYLVACGGLLMVIAGCISTFLIILSSHSPAVAYQEFENVTTSGIASGYQSLTIFNGITDSIILTIQSNMTMIITLWLTGSLLFSLRLINGWFYIGKLKKEAHVLDNEWNDLLQKLAWELQLKKAVQLAESAMIDAPIVIGYLKPVILVPIGMFTGLTTEQIETIFIHELAHIRRHDYMINLLQSVIESLLFFNPFIWILSRMIRNEREYCCDDAVIKRNGNALAYAHALTRLEEARLSKKIFALSLAENKNQLLNRIKRIMKRSVKNYSVRDRIIPAMLVIIGLVCASWLTIQSETPSPAITEQIMADTIVKKNQKSAKYSRKAITTTDKEGNPNEEIVEIFEGDEELRPVLTSPDLAFTIPFEPNPVLMPAIPDAADIFLSLPPDTFFDSIPRMRSREEWKKFNEEFKKQFSEKFGDFYKKHGKDLEKMMTELTERFEQETFSADEFLTLRDHALAKADMELLQQKLQHLSIPHEEIQRAQEHAELAMKELQELRVDELETVREKLELRAREMETVQERMEVLQQRELLEMEAQLKATEDRLKEFEKDLKEQLLKDGYIGKNDKIENLHWEDNGELKINGKKIREADRPKYEDLHRKYFRQRGGDIRIIE